MGAWPVKAGTIHVEPLGGGLLSYNTPDCSNMQGPQGSSEMTYFQSCFNASWAAAEVIYQWALVSRQ